MPALTQGTKAPAIELPLIDGGRFSLHAALEKSPVVLAFFKISCPVCQYAFPYYERLARSLASTGVTVVGVSQDDEDATRRFVKSYGVRFPIALEDTRKFAVSDAYGLTNVPTLFEVAQDGTIAVSCVGWEKAVVEEIHLRHNSKGAPAPPPLFPKTETIADFKAG